MSKKVKVVLDTNVWISLFLKNSLSPASKAIAIGKIQKELFADNSSETSSISV
jgi:predicted nucleic acid-binding protein